jgi:transposase-like protein
MLRTVTSEIEQEPCTSCPHCELPNIVKNGRDRRGAQVYRCADCYRSFTALTGTPFSGHSFPPAVIGLAVRWYLRYRLSYADVVEWLAERHIQVDPSTVFDWVQKFAPLYQEAAKVYRRRVGPRWSVDETFHEMPGPCQAVFSCAVTKLVRLRHSLSSWVASSSLLRLSG